MKLELEEVPEERMDLFVAALATKITNLLSENNIRVGAPTALALTTIAAANAKAVGKSHEDFVIMAAVMYEQAPRIEFEEPGT